MIRPAMARSFDDQTYRDRARNGTGCVRSLLAALQRLLSSEGNNRDQTDTFSGPAELLAGMVQ
jgi:hypothetical protein